MADEKEHPDNDQGGNTENPSTNADASADTVAAVHAEDAQGITEDGDPAVLDAAAVMGTEGTVIPGGDTADQVQAAALQA